jgi:hypothetical protein
VKRIVFALLIILVVANLSLAEEATFRGVKFEDANGKQMDAILILNDGSKNVIVRIGDRDVTMPYDQIDKFSYAYTRKRRVYEGLSVMGFSPLTGAVIMLTKSKSHWLYIDYHEQAIPKTVLLRMDKAQYQKILDAIKVHTGKEVQLLGEDKSKEKKSTDQKQN